MKKIDKLVLTSFIGPFILTFLVVVFILLNIQMLKYFDDIIGKGLGWDVIGKLLFYFAIFTTPTAMPLSVLLSSLITFGNLGEHFELTAIKSSGISLLRTLLPIFFFVLALTAFAFYINNSLVPKAALEAYSLLYDIKQKKPALELREGAFYMGLPDISIKIGKKFSKDEAALKGVVIYDHRENEGNKDVTVADSGRMYTILNERYLKLELYNGYNYTEGTGGDKELAGAKGNGSTESLRRMKFSKTQFVFDLSSFDLQKTDPKWFQGNRIMRNVSELDGDIDSLNTEVTSMLINYYMNRPNYFSYYRRDEPFVLSEDLVKFKAHRDSVSQSALFQIHSQEPVEQPAPIISDTLRSKKIASGGTEKLKTKDVVQSKRKATALRNKILNSKRTKPSLIARKNKVKKTDVQKVALKPSAPKLKITDSLISHRIDSLIAMSPTVEHYQKAANEVRQVKSTLTNNNTTTETYIKDRRVYEIQWHKIIASSMACIAMFLIGAPLGAIIKKGGLGVPFLVSIVFFIVFYILNMIGEKWAKQGAVSVMAGVWAADFILLAVGLVFLRQARVDARLFDTDFYLVLIDKLKRRMRKTKPVNINTTPG